MNITIKPTKKTDNPIKNIDKSLIEKQYQSIFGKKDSYTENEVFVFNSIYNVQKILERDKN